MNWLTLKLLRLWHWSLCFEAARIRYQIDSAHIDDLFCPELDRLRALYRSDLNRISEVETLIVQLQTTGVSA